MEFQFFYFYHVYIHIYVTTASAGRHNVLLCEVSHQIMRHNTWLQGQYLQNYPMAKKCILCTVTFSILLFIGDACSVQLQSGDSQVVLNTLLGTL